ncbi:galactokinase family protein [Bowdeniella massiliensis]|uniref:galactokinase family protein n=1 Tax=Bowdeniella massiliensis TaxID=2932264 RepID=UPI002028A2F9
MITSWFVPGRIEVLGKHTDYAGGRSLLAAADVGITFHARALSEPIVRITSRAVDDTVTLPLAIDQDVPRGHWAGYPAAVVSRLVANFPDAVSGAHITVDATLPLASGMSSSSAMIVGLARSLFDLSGIEDHPAFTSHIRTPEDLAMYLACVENGMSFGELAGHRGVGTFGGSEDHTAMLCAEADALVQYRFCPTTREAVIPFPADYSFVVAVSGVLAEKTGSAMELYNRAALSTSEIVRRWNRATGRKDVWLADAVRAGGDAHDQLRSLTSPDAYLRGRLEQFISESEDFVPRASAALAAGRISEFGRIVDTSQRWSEEGLGNQVPETVHLQRSARSLGAAAASAFGAGFGGSVWALVKTHDAEAFAAQWLADYQRSFPEPGQRATTLITRPGGRAHRIS